MLTASVLAKNVKVPIFTVRYYTRIGLLQPQKQTSNGYKIYQPADETRLKFILSAKDLGFTLAEITQILDKAEHGESPCPSVRKIIVHHIEENKRKMHELQKLQKKMENALKDWENLHDEMPNGTSVCHLIESVAAEH
ncbi:MAG TPA: MerR family DNA-binding protein [Pyrinomonadaceae bacterium]|nr:MerR family DNA-binding protein [Pyrinomonadaceae bacterium]